MSAEWVDKADNPGMAELGLHSFDIYGAVTAVNFADLTWRTALTSDFLALRPVTKVEQLHTSAGLHEATDRAQLVSSHHHRANHHSRSAA